MKVAKFSSNVESAQNILLKCILYTCCIYRSYQGM